MGTLSIIEPQWCNTLISLGVSLGKSSVCKKKHITLILCLPRPDFATPLLALGALGGIFAESDKIEERKRIESLCGQWVEYPDKQKLKRGLMVGFDSIDEQSYAVISLLKCKPPNFSLMTSEQRMRYRPPPVTEKTIKLPTKIWGEIKPLDPDIAAYCDVETGTAGGRGRARTETGESGRFADRVLGDGFTRWVHRATTSQLYLQTTKNRLKDELELSVHEMRCAADERSQWIHAANLSPLLPDHVYRMGNGDFELNDTENVCILEANRTLEDALHKTKGRSRIVILSRNQASYSECAGILGNYFSDREAITCDGHTQNDCAIPTLAYYD